MAIALQVDVRDDVSAALARAAAAAIDLTPAMRDIAGHLADATRERFETGRSPAGMPWKPSRRAEEEGGKTLVDRGDLLSSITEDWGKDYAAAGPEASGGAAIYAAIHQFGGEIRPRTAGALSFGGRLVSRVVMPARPYLGFTDEDADYAVAALADHLQAAIGGAGTGETAA